MKSSFESPFGQRKNKAVSGIRRLGAVALVAALMAWPMVANAATFTVSNLTDGAAPGPAGSLRAAVNSANSAAGTDTINFQAGLTGTITLTDGQLTLSDTAGATTVTGPGANLLTISGNNTSRVFQVNGGVTAAVSGLTIANGSTNAGGAGIYTEGPLTLTACVFRNNSDTSEAGGGAVLGGGASALTITGCLFSANQAVYGAAIEHYSGNQAVITNSTISGNAISGVQSGIIDAPGAIRLESCTVTGNSAPGSAGAVNIFGGTVQYLNTIVSGNSPVQFANNGGTLTSLGRNISSDGTGNLTAPGDLPNTDPLLGPLADNGGPTQTCALLSGSPAIDAGDPVTFPSTDQRGSARPEAVAGCAALADIGAFEVQSQDCNANFIPDACDIAAPHIYWSNDSGDLIQRAIALPTNLSIQTVVPTGTAALRGVAVDTVHAKVYWADISGGVIKRSNLDGSGVVTLVPAPDGSANDITLDVAGGRMIWANFTTGTIYRADLNGGGVTPLVSGQSNVSGVALDLAGGKMYWVLQTSSGQIRRANLDGTNIEMLISVGLNAPIDITLDVPGGKMYWSEFGGNRIRRANLDGTGMQDLVTGFASATSVELDRAAGKLYFSSSTQNKIERANLDGTDRENIAIGVGQVFRMAFIQRTADCNASGTPDECDFSTPFQRIYAAAPGTPIPDGNPTGISNTITVPSGGVIADLNVLVNIPHGWQGDVVATLSHGGVTQTLINRTGLCSNPTWGYSAPNFGSPGGFLILDDAASVGIDCYAGGSSGVANYAGPAQPSQPLAAFNGQNSAGEWTLTVSDPLSDYTGMLAAWAIAIHTTAADCNGNGVPDECEPDLHRGDMNCDCAVNLVDVPGFIEALVDPAAYVAIHPGCAIGNGDMQPDGQVNGRDVQVFVDKLTP